jgi:hypothetical protein
MPPTKQSLLARAMVLSALISTAEGAETNMPFLTHCSPDQFAVVNARLGSVDHLKSQLQGHLVIARNGRVLSLCADKPEEPFGKLVYRYGPIGSIELETTASSTSKFGIYTASTSPHTGVDIVFFSIGRFTYYVLTAIGQGNGVSLMVFDSRRKVLDLFSGNDSGIDFVLGPAYMTFVHPSSPIFRSKRPEHEF